MYHLSTRVLVNEDWCSSGLALSVHNLLSRTRIIRIRFRMNLLLFYSSPEWRSRGDWWSHSRKEACIICIEWWIGIIPLRRLARSSAAAISSGVFSSSEMTSSSSGWLDSSYRGFNEVVDWEVLTSLGTEGLVVLEGLSSVLFRKNEWDLVERAWGLLLLWWHDIDEVEYSEANRVIRQWNAKQTHLENDV